MKTIEEIRKELETRNDRSVWNKGVTIYALELLNNLEEFREFNEADKHIHPLEIEHELLNGAKNWSEYSLGGSSLIYDFDIAKRLCTPSELKRSRNGERNPNSREQWLDVQVRALSQACSLIKRLVRF